MAITATIKNVVAEGTGIRVFADFSDGQSRSYPFEQDVTRTTIRQTIREDVKQLNDAETKANNLTNIIGEVIE